MRRFALLLLTLLLLPLPLTGQVADTVRVTILGDVAGITIDTIEITDARIGDTIPLRATVVDSEGDPVPSGVLITWASSDTTILRITDYDPETGNANAVALRKGTVLVMVLGEPFDQIAVGFLRDGVLVQNPTIAIGEQIQGCAFLLRGTSVIGTNSEPCLAVVPLSLRAGPAPALWIGDPDRVRLYRAAN